MPGQGDRRTTVVVVHRNAGDHLPATVDALAAGGVDDLRVVIVDNGSEPSLAALLDELGRRRGVEVVRLGHNLGFGPAANVGLRRWLADPSAGEWAFVCPHDAMVDAGTLAVMLDAGEAHPSLGLMCADIADGTVPVIDPYFGGLSRPALQSAGVEWADYPHGTLMAVRRGCAAAVGLFDERYFAYCEEADIGSRAGRAGWRCAVVHGARVTNMHIGSTVGVVDYLQQRNTLMLVRTMSGRYHAAIRVVIGVWQLARWRSPRRRRHYIYDAAARRAGIVDFIRGRVGPPPATVTRPDAEVLPAARNGTPYR